MRYAIIFFFSYLSLLWERLWDRLWAAVSFALFCAALALLNIPQAYGEIGAVLFLLVFAVVFAVLLLRTGKPFDLPARTDVERHIERASALKHRPLQTLKDKPTDNTSPEQLGVWQQHMQYAARFIGRMKIYMPTPDVSRRDTWGVRHAAILFFAVGLVVAQNNARARLEQVFAPDIPAMISGNTKAVDLWITPPEYTHLPPVFLATTGQGKVSRDAAVSVPVDSVLKLRASGFRFTPKLTYNQQRFEAAQPTPHNFTLEMPLRESGALELSALLMQLGAWNINVTADLPPMIAINKAESTARFLTKMTYRAEDDHGITKLKGHIILKSDYDAQRSGKFIDFDIPASHLTSHTEDFTDSIMAGQEVMLTLEAEDHVGNKTTSAPITFFLPERVFSNAVSRSLAENRKILFSQRDDVARGAVANNLANIINRPALYRGNSAAFLSLVVAAERLMYASDTFSVDSVQDILWNVALKLEEGGMGTAQRDLREALERLSDAAKDKTVSQQQLQEMATDVQKKLQQYLQALANEMQQRAQMGQNMPVVSPEIAQKFMKSIDLNKLIDQLRQISQANSREGLQKMADNLKNMVENLDMKKLDQMQEQQLKAMESLQNIEDTIHRQQALFDKTNKMRDGQNTSAEAKEQSALQKQLGDALQKLGEAVPQIPDNFANAHKSMRDSTDALGKNQPGQSLPHQKTALDEMQKGQDSAIKQMAEAMEQSMLSFGAPPNNGNFGKDSDPLGRNVGDNGDTKIPDEKERRRVQQIIDELRHRSNEPNRTKVEREYIDRLLGP